MFDIQSRAFEAAPPDKRAQMWIDLERFKAEMAKPEMQELLETRKQIEAAPEYDAESLSFQAALVKAGKSPEEVHGLLTLFSSGKPLVREALWNELRAQGP